MRIPKSEACESSIRSNERDQLVELRAIEDCHDAVDSVMRSYLSLLASHPRGSNTEPGAGSTSVAEHPAQGSMAVSLAHIRETMDASHLSPEEYSVLGDFGSDDG